MSCEHPFLPTGTSELSALPTEAALAEMVKLDAAGGATVEDYVLAARAYYFYADTHLRFAGEEDAMLESYQKRHQHGRKGHGGIQRCVQRAREGR